MWQTRYKSGGRSTPFGRRNLIRIEMTLTPKSSQAMLRYGASSPIGLHQEKLLQNAMADIINMTSQNLPLTIGIPLYSFDSPYDSSPAFHAPPSSHTDLLTDPTTRSLPDINPEYTSEEVAHVSKWLDFGDNTALLTPPAKLW